MKQIEGVLFDLDGTLIDSEHFYFSCWQPILATNFGLIITFEDWLTLFSGHTLVRNIHFLKQNWGIETTEEFMWKETRAAYARADMRTISLMPFAKEILENLLAAGKRIGLVTSSYQTTVETVLGHHGLLEFFEFFVTREKVVHAKPNPEPYLLAIEKMEILPEKLVAVEDTATGLRAAQDAGLRCIAASRFAAERAKLQTATYVVESLVDVHKILL